MTDHSTAHREEWALPAHQARSRDQRDRILEAGERVFASQGFWEAHVDDIARLADCSVGSFYRRFKDKEALFFALQEDLARKASVNVEKFYSDPRCLTLPLTAVIYKFVENSCVDVDRMIGYYRELSEIGLRGETVWDQMRQMELRMGQRVVQLLKVRGYETPSPDDLAAEAAYAYRMIGAVNLSVLLYGRQPFDGDETKRFALLTRMLMQILRVAPDESLLEELMAKSRAKQRNPPTGSIDLESA